MTEKIDGLEKCEGCWWLNERLEEDREYEGDTTKTVELARKFCKGKEPNDDCGHLGYKLERVIGELAQEKLTEIRGYE